MVEVEGSKNGYKKVLTSVSNENLHPFWKFTIKWWFFPSLYIFLASLYIIIVGLTAAELLPGYIDGEHANLLILYFMPHGLIYLLETFPIIKYIFQLVYYIPGASFLFDRGFFPLFFHLFFIASIIKIQNDKIKKRKVLKWLIVTLILLLVLSFSGCVIGSYTGYYRIGD